jgi:hypothetical protein
LAEEAAITPDLVATPIDEIAADSLCITFQRARFERARAAAGWSSSPAGEESPVVPVPEQVDAHARVALVRPGDGEARAHVDAQVLAPVQRDLAWGARSRWKVEPPASSQATISSSMGETTAPKGRGVKERPRAARTWTSSARSRIPAEYRDRDGP